MEAVEETMAQFSVPAAGALDEAAAEAAAWAAYAQQQQGGEQGGEAPAGEASGGHMWEYRSPDGAVQVRTNAK